MLAVIAAKRAQSYGVAVESATSASWPICGRRPKLMPVLTILTAILAHTANSVLKLHITRREALHKRLKMSVPKRLLRIFLAMFIRTDERADEVGRASRTCTNHVHTLTKF